MTMSSLKNREARDRILDLLKMNPVAFIGAGLSKPYYRDWQGLVEQISEIMGATITNGIHPKKQAQELLDYNEEKYRDALVEIFEELPEDCSETLKKLIRCGFKSYVTTNYDCSIERAFEMDHRQIPIRGSNPPLPECYLEDVSIHHIHGTIDPDKPQKADSIVLDDTSYVKAYTDNRDLSNFIFSLFDRQNVLFTGYSLDESEPIHGIVEIVEKRLMAVRHFSARRVERKRWAGLFPEPIPNDKTIQLERIGIEIIKYDPLDENHTGLTDIWIEVSENSIPKPSKMLPPILDPFADK